MLPHPRDPGSFVLPLPTGSRHRFVAAAVVAMAIAACEGDIPPGAGTGAEPANHKGNGGAGGLRGNAAGAGAGGNGGRVGEASGTTGGASGASGAGSGTAAGVGGNFLPGGADDSSPASGRDGGAADVGTGTGSGLPATLVLEALTSTQKKQLCEWGTSQAGGAAKEMVCPGGRTVRLPWRSIDMCVANVPPAPCKATIEDAERCARTILEDPCVEEVPPACKPLSRCVLDRVTGGSDGA